MNRQRSQKGVTLVMVLLMGAVLFVMATTVFSLSVNNSRTTVNNRAQTEAYLSADSALAHLRNTLGSELLTFDDRGEPLPPDSGSFGLYRSDGQFYFGYSQLSDLGQVTGMHSLMNSQPLGTTFEATRVALRDSTAGQRWWIHQLGAVRWIPLSIATVSEGDGVVPVAIRQVEVLGESGADGSDARSAVAQTLRLAVDLKSQRTTRRPEVALGAVPVAKVTPEQSPVFILKASADQESLVRIEGPVLIDAPKVEGDWARLTGKAKVTLKQAIDPLTQAPYGEPSLSDAPAGLPLNPELFALAASKDKAFLLEGGERRFARPGNIELEADFGEFEAEERPGTLQLTVALAEFVGRAGTVLRKDFNPLHNILNPRGEKIYDAKKAEFDFTKTRRGILYFEKRKLLLKGEPSYKTFRYRGQGTLVVTGEENCLTLENSSLVAATSKDSLTILCALKPLPPGTNPNAPSPTTGTPVGTPTDAPAISAGESLVSTALKTTIDTTVKGTVTNQTQNQSQSSPPGGVKLLFSAAVPVTVLANRDGVPYTVEDKDLEKDFGAPRNLPTTLKRLISGVSVDDVTIPSGARAVTLDKRNYILARLSDQERTEVLISLGSESERQRGSVQFESVSNAQVVPLMRLQAQVFSNTAFVSEGTARVIGSVIAPSIYLSQARYSGNPQNGFYADAKYGNRFLFDAIYRRPPETLGTWLMTFRPSRRPTVAQVQVARVDGLLWQRFSADQLRTPPAADSALAGTSAETLTTTPGS